METSQTEKMEKYNTGIPNRADSTSNMNNRGIFNTKNKARERIINFCSCLFFMGGLQIT